MPRNNNNENVESNRRRRILLGLGGLGAAGLAGAVGAGADSLPGFGGSEPAAAQSLWFAGLEQTALGDASLGVESDSLVVSNVDEEGDDGVSVDVGETRGFMSRMTLNPDAVPAGAYLHRSARGIVDGESDLPIWNIRLSRSETGATFEARPDFRAIGSETYTLRLYDGDEVVYEQGGHTEPTLMQQKEPTGIECCGLPPIYQYWEEYEAKSAVDADISYVPPDAEAIPATRVDFEPDEIDVQDTVLTGVNVRGAGMSAFKIDDQLVGAHGRPHRADGAARLAPSNGGSLLTVSNVQEPGDGVTALLDDVEGFRMDLDSATLDEGDAFVMSARGTFDGEPDTDLGSVTVANESGEMSVVADYEAIGADEVRVDVFDGEEQVTTAYLPPGQIASAPYVPPLGGCGKLPPWPLPCYLGRWDQRVEFGLADGTTVVGDDLRILAQGAEGSIESLSRFSLGGLGVGSFGVINEATGDIV